MDAKPDQKKKCLDRFIAHTRKCKQCLMIDVPFCETGRRLFLCYATAEKKANLVPVGGKDAWTGDVMPKIARQIEEQLPHGWGFFVMAFPFAGGKGRMHCVSNAKRDSIKKLMLKLLAKGGDVGGHR